MEQVRSLTKGEIDTYQSKGVTHVPGLISKDFAADLLEAADTQRRNPGPNSMDMTIDGKFWEEREVYLLNEKFRSFAFSSNLAREAARAMASQETCLYFDHLFMLDADTAKDQYYWHQDQPYWACEGQQVCSFWLALTDCSVDSGSLELVLGTDDILLQPEWLPDTEHAANGATEIATPAYHQARDRYEIISWDIKAGDAILFNARIMHSSRGNHSKTQRRVAYSTRWIGDDMTFVRRPGYNDPVTVPDGDPKDGMKLKSFEKFPSLWPKRVSS